jgi:hypothetical protein
LNRREVDVGSADSAAIARCRIARAKGLDADRRQIARSWRLQILTASRRLIPSLAPRRLSILLQRKLGIPLRHPIANAIRVIEITDIKWSHAPIRAGLISRHSSTPNLSPGDPSEREQPRQRPTRAI